jgi:hypothetical protein
MSRLAATLSALALASALAAGCGATGGSTQGAAGRRPAADASIGALRARSDAVGRVTKAEGIAFAHAVNLTVADVREATTSRRRRRSEHEPAECGLVGSAHEIVDVKSPLLSRGAGLEKEQISSGVSILSSARVAEKDVASAQSAKGRACLARLLRQRLAGKVGKGVSFGHLALVSLPVQAPGADGSVGLRIVMSLIPDGTEVSIPAYVDLLVFTRGPAEISLVTISSVQPEPATTEQQLMSLLVRRATTHTL